MFNQKNKAILASIIILIIFSGGLYFIRMKINNLNRIIYPKMNITSGNYTYFIDARDSLLYRSPCKKNNRIKLSDDKVDSIGIIVIRNKIFYINKISKKLCQIDNDGRNKSVIDECNIFMPYQPIFKLGKHLYYYDLENNLMRISADSGRERI